MTPAESAPPRGAVPPDKGAVVPAAAVRTYYDRPVVKPPVWKPEVPWYFFFGGMSGASSMLAAAAGVAGDEQLARAARRAAAVAAAVSPALLIADLGVPSRFANMLRVFRPTSPLNMGSWLLSLYAPAAVAAGVLGESGRLPRLRRTAEVASAAGGLGMTTYTAVLIADTAVPVWHEARRELPFVFAGTAGATAGAAATVLSGGASRRARRLTLLGTGMGQAATKAMERRLGEIGEPYEQGTAGSLTKAAKALTLAGTTVTVVAGRRRPVAVGGALLVLAGGVFERWAVFRAGFQSAETPEPTVKLQRQRLSRRVGSGADAAGGRWVSRPQGEADAGDGRRRHRAKDSEARANGQRVARRPR